MKDMNENTNISKQKKQKFSIGSLVYPMIIIVILAVFAGVVYYAKFIKPRADIDKEIGYKAEEYIELGKYTGFDYEISQEDFDEWVSDETDSYESVDRAAKDTDQVDFSYVGYVDGKKDKNITEEELQVTIGEKYDGVYDDFSEAIKGHKADETVTITVDDATELSKDGSDYSGKKVTFKIMIESVSELVTTKVTDKWVYEEYYEDYGLETAEDFYEWCKNELEANANVELWQKTLGEADMSGYPQNLYDSIVTEFTQNTNYYADEMGMSAEEYLAFSGYTDESLEEEYLTEVKSELVMWAIVKKHRFDTTEEEIEEKYEELYLEVGYETVEDMKQDYTHEDIRKAVLLDKVQAYIYDNSNIKKSFKIPN